MVNSVCEKPATPAQASHFLRTSQSLKSLFQSRHSSDRELVCKTGAPWPFINSPGKLHSPILLVCFYYNRWGTNLAEQCHEIKKKSLIAIILKLEH